MNKKIIIITLILILSILLVNHLNYQNESISEMKLKDSAHNNAFSILVSDSEGNYSEYENSTLPNKDEYKFNNDMSKCIDNNGNVITNSLVYDDVNNLVTVKTNKTSYCYLYYSINNTITFTLNKVTKYNELNEVATYEAESGMTWAEWIGSKYNIDEILYLDCGKETDWVRNRGYMRYNSDIVKGADFIVENGIYSVQTTGTPEPSAECDYSTKN